MKRSGPPARRTPLAQGEKGLRRTPLKARGRTKVCARVGCGEEFYVPPSKVSQRFCSRACARLAVPTPVQGRKAQGEAQRRNGKKRGAGNPAYRHGRRSGIKGGPRFKSGQTACAACGRETRAISESGSLPVRHEHHVVYAQHVTRAKGDVTDSLNALALCVRCHLRHHRRTAVVPLARLRDENYAYAAALLGAPAAYEYLRRRYAGEDARLTRLLGAYEAP